MNIIIKPRKRKSNKVHYKTLDSDDFRNKVRIYLTQLKIKSDFDNLTVVYDHPWHILQSFDDYNYLKVMFDKEEGYVDGFSLNVMDENGEMKATDIIEYIEEEQEPDYDVINIWNKKVDNLKTKVNNIELLNNKI